MSKQSEAKEMQHYTMNNPVCQNCENFRSNVEVVTEGWNKGETKETKMRCNIGGFAVKKTAYCNEHEYSMEGA